MSELYPLRHQKSDFFNRLITFTLTRIFILIILQYKNIAGTVKIHPNIFFLIFYEIAFIKRRCILFLHDIQPKQSPVCNLGGDRTRKTSRYIYGIPYIYLYEKGRIFPAPPYFLFASPYIQHIDHYTLNKNSNKSYTPSPLNLKYIKVLCYDGIIQNKNLYYGLYNLKYKKIYILDYII